MCWLAGIRCQTLLLIIHNFWILPSNSSVSSCLSLLEYSLPWQRCTLICPSSFTLLSSPARCSLSSSSPLARLLSCSTPRSVGPRSSGSGCTQRLRYDYGVRGWGVWKHFRTVESSRVWVDNMSFRPHIRKGLRPLDIPSQRWQGHRIERSCFCWARSIDLY